MATAPANLEPPAALFMPGGGAGSYAIDDDDPFADALKDIGIVVKPEEPAKAAEEEKKPEVQEKEADGDTDSGFDDFQEFGDEVQQSIDHQAAKNKQSQPAEAAKAAAADDDGFGDFGDAARP